MAAGRLQRSGLIRYAYGLVTIENRAGLEAAACECYQTVEGRFRRLFDASAERVRVPQ